MAGRIIGFLLFFCSLILPFTAYAQGGATGLRFSADLFNMWNHPVFDKPSITDIEAHLLGRSRTRLGLRG